MSFGVCESRVHCLRVVLQPCEDQKKLDVITNDVLKKALMLVASCGLRLSKGFPKAFVLQSQFHFDSTGC